MTDRNKSLSFVLPLALQGTGRDHHDLGRAHLLLRSLERQLQSSDIREVLVVTRDDEASLIQERLKRSHPGLPLQFLRETLLCPLFAENPLTVNLWPRRNTGWFRQQLIKLAAYQHVTSEFYMVLDADVIFVRPFRGHDLILGKQALFGTITADALRRLFLDEVADHEINVRRHRIGQAESVLALKRPEAHQGYFYSETPVVLSTHIVAAMASHLEHTWHNEWQRVLIDNLPWTEFNLYGVFAEASAMLDKHHIIGGLDTVLRLSKSLWRQASDYREPMDLDRWDVEAAFAADAQGIAIVVQSYLGYTADAVMEKASRCFAEGQ
ncbi:MAG: DUF6492 family protein [Prochlorococcaceae cyanobacterium]